MTLTTYGKQVIREIAFNKFKKPFSQLTPMQKRKTVDIFTNDFLGKKGNVENKLKKIY